MSETIPVHVGEDAIPALLSYCREKAFKGFVLVCDENTYRALGKAVHEALVEVGCDVIVAKLEGEEIAADEASLVQVLLKLDRQERIFLAVGSGTLTDIARFISHRTRTAFISVPTAPSVDGFISWGAPLIIKGLKLTFASHPPLAVFADLPTLRSAPPALIAAGFGDLVGKLVSNADWKLGHILWGEPFDEAISERSRQAALRCAENAAAIGRAGAESVRWLFEGLIESGYCMLDFGGSQPASGAEHHLAHLWEMKMLEEHRPAIFHGIKVGVASVITAGWYDAVRGLTRDEVAERLEEAARPRPEALAQDLRRVYGPASDEVMASQKDLIFLSDEAWGKLKQRILARWDEVQAVAVSVPTAEQMAGWLRQAGAPVSGEEIGLSEEEIHLGREYGHYLRPRFTINKLRSILGIP